MRASGCSRWLVWLFPLVSTACASGGGSLTLSSVNTAQLRSAVLTNPPPEARFIVYEGDAQYVNTPGLWPDTYGIIQPHDSAHLGSLRHGKILARIQVDRDYLDMKKDKWYYWVLVNAGTPGSPDWKSAFIAADGSAVIYRNMTPSASSHTHTHTSARWRNRSKAVPWATCALTTCCCEGSECNDMRHFSLHP